MFGLSLVKKNPATGHYELSPGTEVIAQFPDTDDSAPNPLKMHATALAIDSQGRVIQGGRAIQDVWPFTTKTEIQMQPSAIRTAFWLVVITFL